MNIVLMEYVNKTVYDAGNKARDDALKIAKQCGYQHIPLYHSGINKIVIIFQICKGICKTMKCVKKGDKIFVQYPYTPSIVNKFLFIMLKLGKLVKKYSLILLLHDVTSLRDDKVFTAEGNRLLKKELDTFASFDKVICHNEVMKEKFMMSRVEENYVILSPFDYLYSGGTAPQGNKNKPVVVIAGCLNKEKSGYVYQILGHTNIYFNLYGIGYIGESDYYVQYKGQYPPSKLIEYIEGDYGLVWDGPSCDTCEGAFGRYLEFNNPHKFSLYIAAGLPIIIWNGAALKNYVEENQIGFAVDSIWEIESKVKLITKIQYENMRNNILKIRDEIIKGQHLAKWL